MDQCFEQGIGSNDTLREFATDFLEYDPMFFRSGYFKELLLDKLKRIGLRDSEKNRLRAVLIDAIKQRGHRE